MPEASYESGRVFGNSLPATARLNRRQYVQPHANGLINI